MLKLKLGNRGFSIAEVLIAVLIISSLVGFFTLFGGRSKQRIDRGMDIACSAISNEVLDKLRAIGYEKSIATIVPGANRFSAAPSDAIDYAPAGAQVNPLNMDTVINVNGSNYEIKTYRGTIGIMSLLSTIYNSNSPNVCTSGVVFSGGAINLMDSANITGMGSDNLRNVQSRIRIQAYDLRTGTSYCEPTPIRIRPRGVMNLPSGGFALTADSNVVADPNARVDVGFNVSIYTTFTDKYNVDRSCSTSGLFQYPVQEPSRDLAAVSARFVFDGSAVNSCSPTFSSAPADSFHQLIVTAPNYESKGLTLLCRDTSTPGVALAPPCSGFPGGMPTPPNVGSTRWVPCQNVTVCGDVSPNNFVASAGSLTMRYKSIPWGCRPHVDVRVVDSAMNITQVSKGTESYVPSPTTPDLRTCNVCTLPGYTGLYCVSQVTECTLSPVDPPGPGTDGGGDGGTHDGGDGGGSGDGDDGGNF